MLSPQQWPGTSMQAEAITIPHTTWHPGHP